jgi:hypothetical protein
MELARAFRGNIQLSWTPGLIIIAAREGRLPGNVGRLKTIRTLKTRILRPLGSIVRVAWMIVEDVAEAIELAWATPNLPNDIYTIIWGKQYSIGDMLAAFERARPEISYCVVPETDANYHVSGDPPGPCPSNACMQQEFGWVPSAPLDDGVQSTSTGSARTGHSRSDAMLRAAHQHPASWRTLSFVSCNHIREQVQRMTINGAGIIEDGRLNLRVPRAGWHHPAATPATHQQVLDEHFLAGVPARQPIPEREPASVQ